jgi:ketosteroid isomerase-like protein
MSRENVKIAERAIEAFNRRGLAAMRLITASDVELDWSASLGPSAGVYRGWDEVLSFYAEYFDAFEETSIEPDRFIDAGESVVVPNVGRVRGRDGIEARARSTVVFTIREGRVSRICLYQETEQALEAVGLAEWRMSQTNADLIRAYFDEINTIGEPVRNWLHSDIRWHLDSDHPDQGVLVGIRAVAAYFRDWLGAFDKTRIDVGDYIGQGEYVVTPIVIHGRLKGSTSEVPLTETWVFKLRDGLIIEVREYLLLEEALKAVEPSG